MTATKKGPVTIPCIIGLPLLLLASLLAIPWMFGQTAYLSWRERCWFRSLGGKHRTLPWREVEEHLREGRGTLIIEQSQKAPRRMWWTADDVRAEAPHPVPEFEDIDFFTADSQEPFAKWCFGRYLSPSGGSALLTRPAGIDFPAGFVTPEFFAKLFPAAQVVVKTLTLPKRAKRG